ncbi:MAG: NYN domain-containing protein [Candidatus Thiodiazotropha endolucinida]
MAAFNTKFSVFIDYDNLSPLQKDAGVLDVVTKALVQIPMDGVAQRTSCDVRVYGGWYEGTNITRLAEKVTVEIQNDFPKVIRLPAPNDAGHVYVTTNAELAVALLQEPGHHLFNTYRKKGKPANVRVVKPSVIGCSNDDCILPKVKKILATGRCPVDSCTTNEGRLVYRHEQKIVDTMLTCDLIHSANGVSDRIVLISGDDDFLPPLRTVMLKGVDAIRFHPKPSQRRTEFPVGGARLLEMEL